MQGDMRGPEGSGVGIELWLECKMKLKIKEKKSDLLTWANLLTALMQCPFVLQSRKHVLK